MILGQILHGIADPLMLVPSLPEMIDAAMEKHPNEEFLINDLSAGIFNCVLGIGQISGPLYGSYMDSHFGYRLTSDFVALICLAYALIYFTFGKGIKAFKDSEWSDFGEKPTFGLNYSI